MKEKTSRKPLILGLLVLIVAVVLAALFASPRATPQTVEEELSTGNFLK